MPSTLFHLILEKLSEQTLVSPTLIVAILILLVSPILISPVELRWAIPSAWGGDGLQGVQTALEQPPAALENGQNISTEAPV